MIVFINIFHVSPEHQQRVIDLLGRVTRDRVSKAKGFHSSVLHRSVDGRRVAMYARWASVADYEAMRGDPASGETLAELAGLAEFDPARYEIVEEFGQSLS